MARGPAVLLLAISIVGGCGRVVLQRIDGGVDGSSGQHDATALDRSGPSCEYDADTTAADAAQSLGISVGGGGAFSEPKGNGHVTNISPTWRADCFLVSSSGHLAASVTATFAGNAPAADDHRDALFWSVTGFYPPPPGDPKLFGEGVLLIGEVAGVVASSPPGADAPRFAVSGAFDLSARPALDSRPPSGIAIGFTWVRVYRKGDLLQYHVFPGGPQLEQWLSVDQPASGVNGFFRYHAPLTDDPSLGSDFDYPAWIHDHVTW
jgi:hypothetical protein